MVTHGDNFEVGREMSLGPLRATAAAPIDAAGRGLDAESERRSSSHRSPPGRPAAVVANPNRIEMLTASWEWIPTAPNSQTMADSRTPQPPREMGTMLRNMASGKISSALLR